MFKTVRIVGLTVRSFAALLELIEDEGIILEAHHLTDGILPGVSKVIFHEPVDSDIVRAEIDQISKQFGAYRRYLVTFE